MGVFFIATRILIALVGLSMTAMGCYFVLVGFGVPVEELHIGVGFFRFSSGNMSAGIIFSFFGLALVYLAGKLFRYSQIIEYADDESAE